jgi:hypothetical protein
MKLAVQMFGNARNYYYYFFPYDGSVPSSRNSLRMSTRKSLCCSSHFVAIFTWPTGWRGEWVEATCLQVDLCGMER